ncbi:DUF4411 domain-containing protein [Candidatus Poribacteria bacterium]|nr:MAG: DUF4411 domain-containing protein [Candidatus Poribacteria bacterium]
MNSLFTLDQVIYSLDTSALIAAFHERYPIENFPSLWRKIEELIKNDRLKMSQIVFDEAMRDTDIKQWCDEYQLKPDFQVPIDELVQEKVSEVLSEFPRLVDNRTGKSGADPWVIALAMMTQNCIVVTEENPTNSENRPKIPDACAHFNLQCIKVVDLIKKENWIFE